MPKHDYTELDRAITEAVVNGRNKASELNGELRVYQLSLRHAIAEAGRKPAWRFVDSRLQALRKAGTLEFNRDTKVWRLLRLPASVTQPKEPA